MPTILLAEDDAAMREMVAEALRAEGFQVEAFGDGASLLDRVRAALYRPADRVDLVVSDVRMPGLAGTDVLARARALGFRVPFVLVTAFGSRDLRASVEAHGDARVLDKPFDVEDLCATARTLVVPPLSHGASDVP